MQTQREAQLANELSNLMRQRQLLASVNYRCVIIEELECLPVNLVACKTTEHLKRIQKAIFVEVIELKKELRLQTMELVLATHSQSLINILHLVNRSFDIDNSDLRLTPVVRPSNNPHIVPEITTTTTQTLFSSQNNQVDNCVVKPIRIMPGPAGIVQTAKLRKLIDTREGEYDDFTRASWLSAIDYVNVDGGIVTGCFGDVKKFLKNEKLEKIVAVIKSCTPNTLGDLTVTLKDLSGTIFGTIHYKVLIEERLAKAFTVGEALILHTVSVFSPKQSTHHYLNITKKNIVKIFHKDGGSA
ncbi:hypothetical protein Tco_0626295 [Tanacetum coccineum]|uniref:Homologous recombination OB-fold protein OB-fold domain-containing protein n=1 Tax=Tanacetum coccineum TaxID=301880 RepID=A0ABQ4WJ63_9ASTR